MTDTTDTQRVNIGKQDPTSYKALIALSAAVEKSTTEAGLDPLLLELLKIRISQINGCSFCLRMHTRDALKKGENPDRLAVLPSWGRPATSPTPSVRPCAWRSRSPSWPTGTSVTRTMPQPLPCSPRSRSRRSPG
ncbi:carboxymuconolactone decarboxylase family protein [Streptomyces sp. MS1.AVA.4]|uniref:Carboxymuconolactone decarboxylase family protein n=1 Tax=Streptomyces pratisoli TaxID=3139917 RepID=A0ACC6QRS0_9ACTN